MKNQFTYLTLALFLILVGCGDGESPIRLRPKAANTDGVREQILAMSQFDLDQCKVLLNAPASSPASITVSPGSGGSVGTANAQSDRSEWNSALDKSAQIFGSDEPASAPSANISAPPAARESVTGIRILSREDINFASVDIPSGSSSTARLLTSGTALVTKQVPTRRGGFQTQVDSAEVDLVYNLINGSRGWLCSSVQAKVIESFAAPGNASTKKDFGNRIGW